HSRRGRGGAAGGECLLETNECQVPFAHRLPELDLRFLDKFQFARLVIEGPLLVAYRQAANQTTLINQWRLCDPVVRQPRGSALSVALGVVLQAFRKVLNTKTDATRERPTEESNEKIKK